jgi:hypothetical protein
MGMSSDQPASQVEETSQAQPNLVDGNGQELAHEVQPVPSATPTTPTGKDAFWLAMVVANAALLIAVLPADVLTSSRLGLLVKVVAWLGGSVFLLGYKWFRDRLLNLTRKTTFKIAQSILLCALVPINVSQLQVDIHPLIEPKDAKVQVGEGKSQDVGNRGLKLSLQGHDIIVSDKNTDDSGQSINRKFHLTFTEVLRAWRDPSSRPHWPLIYKVPIYVQSEIDELEIRKDDRMFDSEFWNNPAKASEVAELRRGEDPGVLIFPWKTGAVLLRLPYGSYKIVARRNKCDKKEEKQVVVTGGLGLVTFETELCPNGTL